MTRGPVRGWSFETRARSEGPRLRRWQVASSHRRCVPREPHWQPAPFRMDDRAGLSPVLPFFMTSCLLACFRERTSLGGGEETHYPAAVRATSPNGNHWAANQPVTGEIRRASCRSGVPGFFSKGMARRVGGCAMSAGGGEPFKRSRPFGSSPTAAKAVSAMVQRYFANVAAERQATVGLPCPCPALAFPALH